MPCTGANFGALKAQGTQIHAIVLALYKKSLICKYILSLIFFKNVRNEDMCIRVIHHFFKQAQNETAILNVFQYLKSKISETSDQN